MKRHLKGGLALLLVLATLIGLLSISAAAANEKTQGSASAKTEDLEVQGTSSMGTMMASALTEEQEAQAEEGSGSLTDLTVSGSTATVSYQSLYEAEAVVAIYAEDSGQMLASGTTTVSPTEETATAEVSIVGEIPQYFTATAYLLDSETHTPLSQQYTSNLYTREMQEFLAKTSDDFDQDQVLNLDGDKTTNFGVYSEDTIVANQTGNTNAFRDDGNGTYTVTNPDSAVQALKPGDTVASTAPDKTTTLIKVKTIKKDGNTIVITEDNAELSDFFDYLRVETDTQDAQVSVDNSELEEGIEASEDGPELQAIDTKASYGHSTSYKIEKTLAASKNDKAKVKFAGQVTFGWVFEFKVYLAKSYQYISAKLDYSLALKVDLTGSIRMVELKLGKVKVMPVAGINVAFTPAFVMEASGSISWTGEFKGTVGAAYDSDIGFVNLCSKPSTSSKTEASGKLFVGIKTIPAIEVIDERVCEADLDASFGLEFSAKEQAQSLSSPSASSKHSCALCLAGEINGKVTVALKFSMLNGLVTKSKTIHDATLKLANFYYSYDHKELGWGTCPYIDYLLTVKVQNLNGDAVSGANVTVKEASQTMTTDKNGQATIYLPNGKYTLNIQDGTNSLERKFTIQNGGKLLTVKTANGQIPSDAVRFDGHYYKFYRNNCSTWEEAAANCNATGGYLATVTSRKENNFLFHYVKKLGYKNAYFGYSDRLKEGNWVWENGENSKYTNWALGEPNDTSGGEDYAMFYWKYTNGEWNDGNFGHGTEADDQSYICEWGDSSGTPSTAAASSPQMMQAYKGTLSEKDGKQVTEFTGMLPGKEYVLLVLAEEDTEVPLIPENLFYIAQGTADDSGTISFTYLPRESDGIVRAYGLPENREVMEPGEDEMAKSLSAASVAVSNLTYTGKSQKPKVTVQCNGVTLTEGNDYTLSGSTSVKNAGSYSVTITGTGDYTGAKTASFNVAPCDISTHDYNSNLNIKVEDLTYTGKKQSPSVTVTYYGTKLQKDTDYTLTGDTSATNEGLYTITITGKGNFTGTTHQLYFINEPVRDLQFIWLEPDTFTKTLGDKAFSLKASVEGDGKLTYKSSNTKVATVSKAGKVTVKGVGKATITIKASQTINYEADETTATVTVLPKGTTLSKVTNVKGKKMTVKWKKNAAVNGYEVQYSTDKKFKKNVKKVTIGKSKTTSKTFSKLTKKKKYYVRIRTYQTVSKKKYYSKWSGVKNVTIKK